MNTRSQVRIHVQSVFPNRWSVDLSQIDDPRMQRIFLLKKFKKKHKFNFFLN